MYRSRSTSSVYFDALNQSEDGGSSWTVFDPADDRNSQPNGISMTLKRPPIEVTQNTLTSALTGSKMATNAGIPTGTNKRPLPKALQPKSSRSPATPSAMYGSSLGLYSPGVASAKRDNLSGSMTLPRSPASTAEQRFGVQRMESSPVGSTLLSPAVHQSDQHATTEGGRWNSAGLRPQTAGVYLQGNSTQRPFGVSVDAGGRDSRGISRAHPLASWTAVNAKPVRRREAVVQDSIMPILKAALGKDNDQQDKRIQKQEESVNRQVFGRAGRQQAGSGGTLRSSSMYGSTDDVFGRSNSHLQLATNYGDTTIPRVHLKSHSEVTPPRSGFEDLQRTAFRNSMSSAVSSSDIYGTRPPGAPGVHGVVQKEFRSYDEVQSPSISRDHHSISSNGIQNSPHPSSHQVTSYGLRLTPAEQSSWNAPSSNFVHSNGTTPSPAGTPNWEQAPPLSAPPIPSHSMHHPSSGRSSVDSEKDSWYDPIPVQPRKVILSPSVVLDSPRNLEDTKRSSRSLVFFGESFSPASYPLLAKVESDVPDSRDVDHMVTGRNAKNAGHSRASTNLTPVHSRGNTTPSETTGWVNGFGHPNYSPAGSVVSAQHRTSFGIAMPSPPIGFRDDTPMYSLVTGAPHTHASVNVPALPTSHQATDSMNTEDSGLERWEKDGNDHSADEQDAASPGQHTSGAAAGHRGGPAMKKRSGSWHEDTSEGRGSLSSSPRPNNSDERGSSSPTDDPYLTLANSGSFVDDKMVPSNSILRQLLAENARQTTRNYDETTTIHSFSSGREPRSLHQPHLVHSESTDAEPPPLPPSAPPPSDFDCDANGSAGGIDSESCHSHSTAVQSTVTLPGSTVDPGDRSRSHGSDTLHGSAAEDVLTSDGASWERSGVVVGDARLDLKEDLTRLSGFRETQVMPQRIEATNYASERLSSVIGVRDGGEENEREGERMVVEIVKGPVGVGFCIEGGKGSLSGDRPIAVKRVFKGGPSDVGAAHLRPGDELLSIGSQSLVGLSHYEAWKCIKALPNGSFPLVIQRRRTMVMSLQQQLL